MANISTVLVFHITEQENVKKGFSDKYVVTIVLHQVLDMEYFKYEAISSEWHL